MSYQDARQKQDDERRVEFRADAIGVIEATSNEYSNIWVANDNNTRSNKRTWVEHLSGRGENVGYIDGRPIYIVLRYATINDRKVVFVEARSQLVDWEMIREWLEEHMPESAFSKDGRLRYVDAGNWYQVFQ